MIRRWFAILFPALVAAGPATNSTTRPATRPAGQPPRNAVRPEPLPMMFGVNLSSAEWGERQLPGVHGKTYTYPPVASLDYYKSKGVMLVRLPFRWERVQPALNGPLDAAELGRIDAFLAAARERGMKVIPEPHNYARYHADLIGSPQVPNAAFADFWRKLAEHLRGEPAVYAYDLVNEPHDTQGLWPAAAQAAVDAIRTVDRDRHILVPGDGWSGAPNWPTSNPNLWITDPSNKIVYEAHLYFDRDRSGRYVKSYDEERGSPAVGVDRLKPFTDWLAERNAVGFLGEFGIPANEGDDPRWLVTMENLVNRLKEIRMPACYWAGGPWWGKYPLSIEPRDGEDRPQIKILSKAAREVGGAR